LAGRVPILHVLPCLTGQTVKRGCRVGCELELVLAVTPLALTVLHTQIEYLTVSPGDVLEFWLI
jgi:hypothetical protein